MSSGQPGAGRRNGPARVLPPVVIPAHGRGSRIRELTGGQPKTLLEVAGEPILARLLRAAADSSRPAVVYTPELDEAIPAFLAGLRPAADQAGRLVQVERGGTAAMVGLRRREPRGYLTDLMAIAAELGDELTVLDSDMVVPHGELCGFLSRSRADTGAVFLVAQAAEPPSADSRSIRVVTDACGTARLGPGTASGLPRAIGAYHWRPPAVRLAREFLAGSLRSFHEFMTYLVALPLPIETFPFSAGLNVNTQDDLNLAEDYVRAWAEAAPAGGRAAGAEGLGGISKT
jgi:GTP:adenosylcobinamide-phosphate guanylyltransferase